MHIHFIRQIEVHLLSHCVYAYETSQALKISILLIFHSIFGCYNNSLSDFRSRKWTRIPQWEYEDETQEKKTMSIIRRNSYGLFLMLYATGPAFVWFFFVCLLVAYFYRAPCRIYEYRCVNEFGENWSYVFMCKSLLLLFSTTLVYVWYKQVPTQIHTLSCSVKRNIEMWHAGFALDDGFSYGQCHCRRSIHCARYSQTLRRFILFCLCWS